MGVTLAARGVDGDRRSVRGCPTQTTAVVRPHVKARDSPLVVIRRVYHGALGPARTGGGVRSVTPQGVHAGGEEGGEAGAVLEAEAVLVLQL